MKKLLFSATLLLLLFSNTRIYSQITAKEAIKHMMAGINIGNTLDPPDGEGTWNNGPLLEYYFDDYKAVGITAVRIPVTWDKHALTYYPYTIDQDWMNRVEQVVDWGLERGFYIVLNMHHEGFIKGADYWGNIDRCEAMWTQIAARFKDKTERLVFEMLNEPHPMDPNNVNDLNVRLLKLIRKTNPTRLVVYAGAGWSSGADLIATNIPDVNDKYLIANFHCYTPWEWVSSTDPNATWGSQEQKNAIKNIFDQVYNTFAPKGIPVMVNEWGAPIENHHQPSRILFYQTYAENIQSHGFGSFAWDDGGMFKTYDRENRTWLGNVIDYIVSPAPQGPIVLPAKIEAEKYTKMSGIQTEPCSEGGMNVGYIDDKDYMNYKIDVPKAGKYKFEFRVASKSNKGKISIEKAGGIPQYGTISVSNTGDWQKWTTIATEIELAAGEQEIGIAAITGGFNVNWLKITPAESLSIKIEAESYSQMFGVKTEECSEGGLNVGYIDANDWMVYPEVTIPHTGEYTIEYRVASEKTGGTIQLEKAGGQTVFGHIDIPITGGWQKWETVQHQVTLTEGTLSFGIKSLTSGININWFQITEANQPLVKSATPANKESSEKALNENISDFIVYPNPVSFGEIKLHLSGYANSQKITYTIQDLTGKIVNNGSMMLTNSANNTEIPINIGNIKSGLYVITVNSKSNFKTHKLIVD